MATAVLKRPSTSAAPRTLSADSLRDATMAALKKAGSEYSLRAVNLAIAQMPECPASCIAGCKLSPLQGERTGDWIISFVAKQRRNMVHPLHLIQNIVALREANRHNVVVFWQSPTTGYNWYLEVCGDEVSTGRVDPSRRWDACFSVLLLPKS